MNLQEKYPHGSDECKTCGTEVAKVLGDMAEAQCDACISKNLDDTPASPSHTPLQLEALKKLEALNDAFNALNNIWISNNNEAFEILLGGKNYPFDKSFDELAFDVAVWAEEAGEQEALTPSPHDIFVNHLVNIAGVSKQYASAAYSTMPNANTCPEESAVYYKEKHLIESN